MVEQRFGIGEWYGRDFTTLSSEERRHYAAIQFLPRNERPAVACPFMATNPLPIVVPCHRVIGSDGSLRGYGAGLPMKEALLRAEGVR